MSKKNKTQKVGVITAEQIFNMQKIQYNGFACGHGAHGSRKYDRKQAKKNFMREMQSW